MPFGTSSASGIPSGKMNPGKVVDPAGSPSTFVYRRPTDLRHGRRIFVP